MATSANTTWTAKNIILNSYVDEGPPLPEHFRIEESIVKLEDLGEGGVIVQLLVLSPDPYLRGMMKTGRAFTPNQPIFGYVAGKVLVSKNPDWAEGDLIGSSLPFTTIQIVAADKLIPQLSRKLTGLISESEISHGVGILGMPGATSYAGLIDVLRPKQGETIFVSAAAGAVGGVVGMLAKSLYNCKVIGSCGGPEKVELVKNYYGFDHVIDYKKASTAEELTAMIKEFAPEGIDMYFENVGGIHFQAALNVLRPHGRVAVCGWISEYFKKGGLAGSFDPMRMIYMQHRIEGLPVTDWLAGRKGNFLPYMHQWIKEGKVKVKETEYEGIEQWHEAFESLFSGKNIGKVVLRL